MLYMVIERFHPGKVKALYQRFDDKGRLMPDGLHYVNSWIDAKVETCYQVMETDNASLLWEWIENWKDLADFEVVPVMTSPEARKQVMGSE